MARISRILTAAATAEPPEAVNVESDFVVILAALLCALICVVGLIAVARCACLRRATTGGATRSPSPAAANKGIKKKNLQLIPKFTYSATTSPTAAAAATGGVFAKFATSECAICLGEFVEGDEIRVLPQCGHGFHVGCIDTWLKSHSSCPSCRQILVVTRCQKCGQLPGIPSSSRGGSATEPDSGDRGDNSNDNCNDDANSYHGHNDSGFLP